MFETGIRQFRMAIGMVWGRRLDTANLARLVDDALATIAEFGEPGADVAATARRPVHRPGRPDRVRQPWPAPHRPPAEHPISLLFAGVSPPPSSTPSKLDLEALRTLPVTVKLDLIERPNDFRCADVRAAPGHPDHRHHRHVRPRSGCRATRSSCGPALGALSGVLRDEIRPERHHAGQRQLAGHRRGAPERRDLPAGRRRLPGARRGPAGRGAGQPEPRAVRPCCRPARATWASWSWPPAAAGWARTTSSCAGSTPVARCCHRSLAAAARQTFGVDQVNDSFGMTEVMPVSGHHLQPGPPAPRHQHGPGRAARPRDRRAGRARCAGHRGDHAVLPVTGTACRCSATTPATWCGACRTSR